MESVSNSGRAFFQQWWEGLGLGQETYIPHGHCYLWQTPLVALHVVSDALIALAYFSIPIVLVYFIYQRRSLVPVNIFVMFGAFIVLCGFGHLLEIWTLWFPNYWLSGIEQAATALVSCYTAGSLVSLVPQFLSLKSPEELAALNEQLQAEVERRQAIEDELRALNHNLERLVEERTAELQQKNAALECEIRDRQIAQAEIVERSAVDRLLASTLQRISHLSANRLLVLNEITDEIRNFLGADRTIVAQEDRAWTGLIVAESVVDPSLSLRGTLFRDPCSEARDAEAYRAGEVKAIDNVDDSTLSADQRDALARLRIKSALIVPILHEATPTANPSAVLSGSEDDTQAPCELWGLLVAHRCDRPRPWRPAEIETLQRLSVQLGIAMQQIALIRQLSDSELEARSKARSLANTLDRLKQTQMQLVQSEKMASLGQMVAGVAHEINNPLSFIYSNLNCVTDYTEDLLAVAARSTSGADADTGDAAAEDADEVDLDFIQEDFPKLIASMQAGANRIRDIVLSLRNFAHLDESDRKVVQVCDSLDSTIGLLMERLQPKGRPAIALETDYAPDLPEIDVYPRSLHQTFFNIMLNAIEALEANLELETDFQPVLSIRAFLQPVEKADFAAHDRDGRADSAGAAPAPRAWVTIEIADNGLAVQPDARDRVFDPFFTTKPIGQGTGLGLPQAHQTIVEQHGGKLDLKLDRAGWKVFAIALPVRAHPPDERPQDER